MFKLFKEEKRTNYAIHFWILKVIRSCTKNYHCDGVFKIIRNAKDHGHLTVQDALDLDGRCMILKNKLSESSSI